MVVNKAKKTKRQWGTVISFVFVQHTSGMDGGAFERVVFHQDGSSLVDEHIHTFNMAFEGSQVQRRVSLSGSNIQVQQRLNQYLKSLVMSMICLRRTITYNLRQTPARRRKRIKVSQNVVSQRFLNKQMETVLTAR